MLENIEFLLFSSHKTSTQTIRYSLDNSDYPTLLLHVLDDIYPYNNEDKDPKTFLLEEIKTYNNTYNKRLKVISVIRNPIDRFISSFFQSNCDNQFYFKETEIEDTTIMKYPVDKLYPLFLSSIKNKTSKYYYEGMYDLCYIFETNIFEHLVPKDGYYYYENDSIELYVLDFKHIHDLNYLVKCLPVTVISEMVENNVTEKKIYYPKYKDFKEKIIKNKKNNDYVTSLIESSYYPNKKEFTFFRTFEISNTSSSSKKYTEPFVASVPPLFPSPLLYQKRFFLFFLSFFLCLFILLFRPYSLFLPFIIHPHSIINKRK
jgi:hypothetical protein